MTHLGHRIMSPVVRAEPVGTREELRLENRLQHQLQGRLHHPVPDGRDPQTALLAARLGDHPFPDRKRAETAVLDRVPQPVEEVLDAPHALHVVGGLTVHSGSAGSLVAPHPNPRNQQERGIGNEVEQIIEPAMRILAGPTVQLRLDLQYPALRPHQDVLQLVSIHRRKPPGLPVLPLLTCCPPSPRTRLSRAPTTTRTPPRPGVVSRRRTCPPSDWLPDGKGDTRPLPTFTTTRSSSEPPSCAPTASPCLRRRPSAWPPDRHT